MKKNNKIMNRIYLINNNIMISNKIIIKFHKSNNNKVKKNKYKI